MKHIKTPSPELQEVNDKIYDLVRRCNKPEDYDQQLDELLKRQKELIEKEGTSYERNSRNRPCSGNIREVQRLQKSLCRGPEGSTLVFQHGLPVAEAMPRLQKKEEGGKRT